MKKLIIIIIIIQSQIRVDGHQWEGKEEKREEVHQMSIMIE